MSFPTWKSARTVLAHEREGVLITEQLLVLFSYINVCCMCFLVRPSRAGANYMPGIGFLHAVVCFIRCAQPAVF